MTSRRATWHWLAGLSLGTGALALAVTAAVAQTTELGATADVITWRVVALMLVPILATLAGWFARSLARDVKDTSEKVHTLEVRIAGEIGSIRGELEALHALLEQRGGP